ncbi:hypothetical protein VTL71DRAFT_11689 [Oculimacula yallundae]|uniref:Gfd2/YDR514C-like C-terminal domain-containing protein n=1 Tax=Oculimacula yallundae TaxID=86028 RepID=A0ABR4CT73_9HELO
MRKTKESEYRIYEIGFSMLDSRYLLRVQDINDVVANRHFVVGGHMKLSKAAKENLFGVSESIDEESIPSVLRNVLNIEDTVLPRYESLNQGNLRSVVLVGHSLHGEVNLLRMFGVDITSHPTVIGIFDTTPVARSVLGKGDSLELLSKALRFPYKNLHSATNDAKFTLRALIMLVHRSLREFPSTEFEDTVFKTEEGRKLAWLQAVTR